MSVLKATLTFVRRKEPLIVATALAELEPDDVDFLTRHVHELRKSAEAQDALLSRFQHGSGVPGLLGSLLGTDEAEFVRVSAGLAQRLQASMDQATKPAPGVLAVIATGEGDRPEIASVLKLDAISEAASFKFVRGQVKLSVLRDLLPAPGQLQKGVSWPDSRNVSDAIVIDRNQAAAHYFFNAFELQVSSTPREAERALGEAIIQHVPRAQRAAAMRFVAPLSGPAEEVTARVRERYPQVPVDRRELGAAGVPGGFIRPNKVPTHMTRFRGDNILVVVPHDRLNRITGPRRVGGGWEMTIRFSARPEEESS